MYNIGGFKIMSGLMSMEQNNSLLKYVDYTFSNLVSTYDYVTESTQEEYKKLITKLYQLDGTGITYLSPLTYERRKRICSEVQESYSDMQDLATKINKDYNMLSIADNRVQKCFFEKDMNNYINESVAYYLLPHVFLNGKVSSGDVKSFHKKFLESKLVSNQTKDVLTGSSYAIVQEMFYRLLEINVCLNELLDTRLVFIDTETDELNNPTPFQVAYLVTDLHLNIIHGGSFYNRLDYISSDSTEITGMTIDKLNDMNALPIEQSRNKVLEIFNQNPRPVFVAHNAQFDKKAINNLLNSDMMNSINQVCSYQRRSCFKIPRADSKLTTLVSAYDITEEDVMSKLNEIIKEDNFDLCYTSTDVSAHDALYDVVALYLLFSKNPQLLYEVFYAI